MVYCHGTRGMCSMSSSLYIHWCVCIKFKGTSVFLVTEVLFAIQANNFYLNTCTLSFCATKIFKFANYGNNYNNYVTRSEKRYHAFRV